MSAIKKFKSLPRPIRYSIITACALIMLFVLTVFVLPAVVKAVAVSQLTKTLGRATAIEDISFNPATLTLEIRGFVMHEPESDKVFVSFDLLRIDAEIVSAFKRGGVCKEISLVKPYVNLVRQESNSYNFSDMLAGTGTEKEAPKEPQQPFRFSLNNISITQGRVDFDDRPAKKQHAVTDINLGVPLFSSFDYHVHTFVQPLLSARVNGKPFTLTGQTKPFAESLESKIDINLKDLNLPEYLTYVPVPLHFKMLSGRLSTQLRALFVQQEKGLPMLRFSGLLSIAALELVTPDNQPILSVPSLSLRGINCTIRNRELKIDEVSTAGIRLHAQRLKDGRLSLQTLVGAAAGAGKEHPPQQKPAAEAAWAVTVKKLMLADASVAVEDKFPQQPVQLALDKINIRLENVSTIKESRGDMDFVCLLNNTGTIGVKGSFVLDPLHLNLNLNLDAIDIRPLQSYIPDNIKLLLTGGSLGLNGTLDMKQDKDLQPVVTYQGDIGLSDFATVSQKQAEDLVKFKSLALAGIRMGSKPLALEIDTITLSDLYAKPVIEPDGTINLAAIAETPPQREGETKEPAAVAPAGAAEQEQPSVKIGSVILENGRIAFTDKSVKPRYAADIANIKGRITNITLNKQDIADINLSAKLNRYAPLTISGKASPLQDKPYIDMKILFKNIDLSPFSPYSGKFIGRMIAKGRLSLDLAYLIKDNQLTAQNKVSIDQFNLGGDVKSPDATGLPVGLAISLLKDRNGNINLDLPMTGNLDDPQFSVTSLILKTLINLIEKAATSPFSLLAGAFSGGGDLSTVLFDCGSATIKDEEAKKIDALVQVLVDKPDIRLEIQGRADPEQDRIGLRDQMVLNKIKAQKLKATSKKAGAAVFVDNMTIAPDEYEEYLSRAYKAESFEKPSILGIAKSLPPDEMKKLMLENTTVTDEDLRQLMEQRALAVRSHIADSGKVEAERVFIIDHRIVEKKEAAGACRVDFMLK